MRKDSRHKFISSLMVFFYIGAPGYISAFEVCNIQDYLTCLNTNEQKCMFAFEKAKILCVERYSIGSISDEENKNETARKFGECFANEYLKQLNIPPDDFEKCTVHLEQMHAERVRDAKEKKEAYDEQFHKY